MARRLSSLAAVHLTATAVVALVASSPANAQSSLSVEVTATVGNACSVDFKNGNGTLDFGTLSGNQQDSTVSELTVSCDISDTTVVFEVDDGLYFGEGPGNGPKLKSTDGLAAYIPYSVCEGEPGSECFSPSNNPFITGPELDFGHSGGVAGGQGEPVQQGAGDFGDIGAIR